MACNDSCEPNKNDNLGNVKPTHTVILDTSPILLNTPSISTLIAISHCLVTTQSVLDEIKGEEARNRLENLYRPFLTIRTPRPESTQLVEDFARRTGDSSVLSQTDLEVLALAYDLECERNGGDWRLRRVPGQKRLNGSPPTGEYLNSTNSSPTRVDQELSLEEQMAGTLIDEQKSVGPSEDRKSSASLAGAHSASLDQAQSDAPITLNRHSDRCEDSRVLTDHLPTETITEDTSSSDSDEGWITPSNIKKRQAQDEAASNTTKSETKMMQVATITGDFAMQNVLLQMNLNMLSSKTCKRISNIKQIILRCHACFSTTKDMSKQFCPRCGGQTLTRVTCTTNDKGEVKLHLKANHQWNNKGNVFSIPKPTGSSANQKWKGPQQGGGKGGWGNNLILAEDQKEYVRAMNGSKRVKNKDLMDEDVLPNILTGRRDHGSARIKVGAGRNVNSKKR